ncbi:unnamed protein product [Trichogramma brassicae]|uniref:Reverse transcriptase domain-containing protein n=1 Tax=Trichogramma brassicae TaxID=86971 RepID=A0A6H5I7H9_9HYME|nr:unnamed protein product [Trichogramma brassicae]
MCELSVARKRCYRGFDLAGCDWASVCRCESVDQKVDLLTRTITALYDQHAPYNDVVRRTRTKPWYSPKLRKLAPPRWLEIRLGEHSEEGELTTTERDTRYFATFSGPQLVMPLVGIIVSVFVNALTQPRSGECWASSDLARELTGVFPSAWKTAILRPVSQKSSPRGAGDFRPISLLCAMSKILERLAHAQFVDYSESGQIIDRYQSGFREGHSTQTALMRIMDDVKEAVESQEVTLLAAVDLSRAFDVINHSILLNKLKHLGWSDLACRWVQ